jgi:FkbM family methyltransferase
MSSRDTRHRLIQKLAWSGPGHVFLRAWLGLRRRIDYVALNQSLHTPTNGELWLMNCLPTKPVVLDVGFNDGGFTEEILAAKPDAQVIAFDPSRGAKSAYTARFMGDPRVKFVNEALSSSTGAAEFHDYGNMSSSLAVRTDQSGEAAASYTVRVRTLDDYTREVGLAKIDFLKIDAEGFDLHVIEGASDLLDRQAIDLFMFEYADGWISSRRFLQEAWAYLGRKPYRLYRLYNGFLCPFNYEARHENFSLGCMFVGVSLDHSGRGGLVVKEIPF